MSFVQYKELEGGGGNVLVIELIFLLLNLGTKYNVKLIQNPISCIFNTPWKTKTYISGQNSISYIQSTYDAFTIDQSDI